MSQVVIENRSSTRLSTSRPAKFTDEGITNEVVNGGRISSYFVPFARPKKQKGATPREGMNRLIAANRVTYRGNSIGFVLYLDDCLAAAYTLGDRAFLGSPMAFSEPKINARAREGFIDDGPLRDPKRRATALASRHDAPANHRMRPRCGAKTRRGPPCQAPAVWNKAIDRPVNGRRKLHGGLSTGPKTDEGRRRSAQASRDGLKRYWAQ